ncbi:MAG: LAGLIDADG family homing endonuclease [Candidatus Levybacteria bacterium]|nr:LAGLIDADG family homing endonuclease [Candidatus Levybacteria bacterium]
MPNTPAFNIVSIGNYLSGYADGEGSFCISFSPRPKLKTLLEVRPSFSVSQNSDRQEVLELFRQFFDCGTIRRNPSDRTFKYEVRSIKDLMQKVIPHFQKYPLLSSKKKEFEKFAVICQMVYEGKHLKQETLKEIVTLSYQMNGLGARRYKKQELLKVLGEDIVYASSN